jgi:hypothetical protein
MTPDVPVGVWWNHKGTLMVGYWELRDMLEAMEREIKDLRRHNEELRETVKSLLAPARPPVPQTGLW